MLVPPPNPENKSAFVCVLPRPKDAVGQFLVTVTSPACVNRRPKALRLRELPELVWPLINAESRGELRDVGSPTQPRKQIRVRLRSSAARRCGRSVSRYCHRPDLSHLPVVRS
jgi:hypothetical protein